MFPFILFYSLLANINELQTHINIVGGYKPAIITDTIMFVRELLNTSNGRGRKNAKFVIMIREEDNVNKIMEMLSKKNHDS